MLLQVYSFGDKDKELVDTVLVLCVLIPQPRYVIANDWKLSSSTLNRLSGHIAPRFFRFSMALGFLLVNLDSWLMVRQHFDQLHSFPLSPAHTQAAIFTVLSLCGDPPHTHQLLSEAGCVHLYKL